MIFKPSERVSDVKQYYFATKLAEIGGMNARGANVLNLGIGSPDLLPPQIVIETLKNTAADPKANMYQSYRGIPELRKAFADHYSDFLNVYLNPDTDVLPLIGSKEGIMHIAMSFLNEGDEVLVPDPGYPAYKATAELAGARARFYDLQEDLNWYPDLDAMRSPDLSKVKIMWINYPNMPTGATVDQEQLKELVAFARDHEILLCHDNPYNFILNKQPNSIFSVDGAKEFCLELYSLSKCFNMAGWRVGAMIGSAELINIVMRFKSNMDSGMYLPVQLAAARALSLGMDWFDNLNQEYSERKKYACRLFDLLNCTYNEESAGLFVWAKVPEYVQEVEQWIDDILNESRVFITPGFIFGKNGQRFVRISLCSSIAQFQEAESRIATTFVKSIA